MSDFIFKSSNLEKVILISPKQFDNENGRFEKNFEKEVFRANNIFFEITEEYKLSSNKGVLRGIHFQDPNPQARLLSVLSGEADVVIVDLRKESKEIGKWEKYRINDRNKLVIYVPKGFGVGTLTRENNTIIEVKCSGRYYSESSRGIRYNDEELNIDWNSEELDTIMISEKDRNLVSFREYFIER